MPMTYTLIEVVKDFSFDGETFQATPTVNSLPTTTSNTATTSSVASAVVKKEQLTKAQKRRQWSHRLLDENGQKPRGHDWVDIIRHLSQTSSRVES